MNVIPNKECILIIHKFELNCIFRIKSDSSSAEFATTHTSTNAKRFIYDKARTVSISSRFNNDQFYTHLVCFSKKKVLIWMLFNENEGKNFVSINMDL